MGRHQFELASEADDDELRQVLSAVPMPGRISVTFRREPSFFGAAVVEGTFRQVIICRDELEHGIVGIGSRSVRNTYVNGEATPTGYLSTLRVLEQHRNVGLVARGFKYLQELHSDGRARLYLTTIAEGNQKAESILTSGRAGLPYYHPAGKYYTLAIPIPKRIRSEKFLSKNIQIRPATNSDLNTVLRFLERNGPNRQFFPCLGSNDFFSSEGTFRDMEPPDLLLAFQKDQLIGTLGGWDQYKFRQTVVNHYPPTLNCARHLFNFWSMLRGHSRLPKPGMAFRPLIAALPVVENNNPDVLLTLVDALLAKASSGPNDFLLLGLHESDDLLPLIMERAVNRYVTQLYYTCWQDGHELRNCLDGRPPYLELGCL